VTIQLVLVVSTSRKIGLTVR